MKSASTSASLFLKAITGIFLMVLAAACGKKSETLETLTAQDLMPMAKGKFITYRVDSLVSVNGGNQFVTKRYRVRYRVDSLGVDNLNQPMWIINTFINDSLGLGQWVQNGQLAVTVLDKRVEVIENNLRVVKLQLPIKQDFTWRGNSFLPDEPYAAYATSINISLWDFVYTDLDQTERIGTQNIPGVTTVFHIDESTGVPVTDRTKYASQERSFEKYAKGIGLVYREHYVWENQPNETTSGNPPVTSYSPKYVGFGIKMWMVDRN
jgi:hypothetical protein